ncbi:hypothetical protein [Myroides sp. WP-1]|uniref:hypothetical protein n=1 Tax=Myroides sp. WP-1 TaxID=2759944 RepID=UPI0015FB5A19|nr:hypothetical protein [Myroides sp. WP-1]MBB1139944.1 hypothetical protein [Myroides sp. WP-1]
MKKICLIMVVLLYGCTPKKELMYNRYYERNSNRLLLLNKDSTFVLQDYSHFVSNGTVKGNYFLNDKGYLCISNFIERLSLPYSIINHPQKKDELKIIVNIDEDVYSNICVFIKENQKDVFLGSLDQKGINEFTYEKKLSDSIRLLFKYEKKGLYYNAKYEDASTTSIPISKGYNEIKIKFDSGYFDFKEPKDVDQRCFRIRKNKFY